LLRLHPTRLRDLIVVTHSGGELLLYRDMEQRVLIKKLPLGPRGGGNGMNGGQATPQRYVRCGPFSQGVYADVPTHEFRKVPNVPETKQTWHGPTPTREGTKWICLYCDTLVTMNRKAAAEQHACDGNPRCAICNRNLRQYPNVGGGFGSWAGTICRDCRDAHDVLSCQSSAATT
jgi:hypothetical protein